MALPKPHIITPDSALGGIQLERSLRFNSGDSTYLERTPSSAGNRKTNTLSFWVKLGQTGLSDSGTVASCNSSNTDASNISVVIRDSGVRIVGYYNNFRITNRILRDPTSWYHIVLVIDTTQASADNRIKIYVNGVQETSFSTSGNVSQNDDLGFAQASTTRVGSRSNDGNGSYFDGYLTEVNFIDGQAYDPSYFGFTDAQTGQWRPKKYGGTYGTTGFHLDFSDNSSTAALGIDKSGNGNNFTPNNFSVASGSDNDSVTDTPTNNFVTLNPLERFTHNCTLSDGNLKATGSSESYPGAAADIELTSGKWYYEFKITSKTNNPICGVCQNNYVSGGTGRIMYRADGVYIMSNSSEPTDPDSFGVGDIIGVAIDLDHGDGLIRFYKNGTLQTVNSGLNNVKSNLSISTLGGLLPYIQMYTGDACTVNFGQQPFVHTPPTGHRALNSKNRATPIPPSMVRPQRHFETLLYTGNNTDDTNITGLEFKPDFVWIKERSGTEPHLLFNSVQRGLTAHTFLKSNTSAVEANDPNALQSFNKDGFQIGTSSELNANSETYAAWCWKAGGTAVSNTDGSITSSVSANQEAGFSICGFTINTSGVYTIGHGLGKAPDWIMMKNRDTTNNWDCYHSYIGNTKRFKLNSRDAGEDYTEPWNDTTPTSSVFTSTGSWLGGDGNKIIAYCWTSIPGYSKMGGYTGNGSSDGPYVHLGFKPAWFLVKADLSESWYLYDNKRNTFNPVNTDFRPDHDYAESSNLIGDFLSDGVKIRATDSAYNGSGSSYFYIAFAERPSGTMFGLDANAR